jgi:hypothetical protein
MQSFFTISMIISGFLMVGFSPISETISKIYECSEIIVQMQTLLFLIAFIPGNFIVIWVLNKFGLRITVSTSQILLTTDHDWCRHDPWGCLATLTCLPNGKFRDCNYWYLGCFFRLSLLHQLLKQACHYLVR